MKKGPRISRRAFLSASFLAGAGLAIDMSMIEPQWLELTTTQVPLSTIKHNQKLKLLHISDLHRSNFTSLSLLEDAIKIGLSASPDLACITGDFISSATLPKRDQYKKALENLSRQIPTFAVNGNHDGGAWANKLGGPSTPQLVNDFLKECGVKVLHSQSTTITVRDQEIVFVGLPDLWSEPLLIEKAFSKIPNNDSTPIILLAHNPDTKKAVKNQLWHLMLSGHTHGGQFVIPFLGITPFAPVNDHRYVAGLNKWGDRFIFTTRGVGNLYGLRFNCRPEVSILELIEESSPNAYSSSN